MRSPAAGRDGRREGRARSHAASLLALAAIAGATAHLLWPILRCERSCLVDFARLRGQPGDLLEASDTRLNVWIQAWVQHSMGSDPRRLFDANSFYPARAALAGSEHLLAPALLALPGRLFTTDAVSLYNLSFALTFLLGGLGSFVCVLRLCGSRFAGAIAGVSAVWMPWRASELSHLQLLSVQWLPLIWLLLFCMLCGEPATRARERGLGLLLAAALALQLLSSFYLAYFTAASCAMLVVALWLLARPAARRIAAVAVSAAPPLVALGLVSLPYLRKKGAANLVPDASDLYPTRLAEVWSIVAPRLGPATAADAALPTHYWTPALVALLALAALALPLGWRRGLGPRALELRRFSVALGAVVLLAFLLMPGSALDVGGHRLPLPGSLASRSIPGFENLRASFRWGIVIGVALPLLAGLGAHCCERWLVARAPARLSRPVAGLVRLLLAGGLVASLPVRPLPARDAWGEIEASRAGYARLASLPFGPVVELPWPLFDVNDVATSTRYMLASTLHWRPILNGFTAYPPPSYALLRRVAQGLPEAEAIARLARLVDLRWIVLHVDAVDREALAAWQRAAEDGRLTQVFADRAVRLYELPRAPHAGEWMPGLVGEPSREHTLTGLPRTAVPVAPGGAALRAELPSSFAYLGAGPLARGMPRLARVSVTNATGADWPGLDLEPEGLFQLRYRFVSRDGRALREATASLDRDVPAGASVDVSVEIVPPPESGRLRLEVELVQRVGARLLRLPVAPVAAEVSVQAWGSPARERAVAPSAHPSSGTAKRS